MTIFYQTFFKNPDADWRYILGYESTFMPKEDFDVFYKVLWNMGDAKAYQPWVDKMRPADRLVIRGSKSAPPNIQQLEWDYAVSGIWIGRTPRIAPSDEVAPTIPARPTPPAQTNVVSLAPRSADGLATTAKAPR